MSLISREWCPKKKRFKKNHFHRKNQKPILQSLFCFLRRFSDHRQGDDPDKAYFFEIMDLNDLSHMAGTEGQPPLG